MSHRVTFKWACWISHSCTSKTWIWTKLGGRPSQGDSDLLSSLTKRKRSSPLEKYFWNDNPVVHLISKPFEVPIKAFYLRRLWSTELLFFGKWTAWRFDMFDIVWLLTVASVSIAARPWGLSSFELVDSSLPRVLFLVKVCFWDFRCIIMALQRECSCSCRAIMESYHDGLGICHFTLADAAW